MNKLVSVRPEFGVNYDVGYIGFTFQDSNFLAEGVAWFTRWEKGENPDVPKLDLSHVIIVSGENECVEAYLPKVRRTPLSDYFDNPKDHIIFRKPVGWTPELGKRIAETAASRVGNRYGVSLIIGQLLANCFLGHFLGWLTRGWSHRVITGFFENKDQFICSELGAYALDQQVEFRGKGILAESAYEIDPQSLFEDREIFEPWAQQVKTGKPKVKGRVL